MPGCSKRQCHVKKRLSQTNVSGCCGDNGGDENRIGSERDVVGESGGELNGDVIVAVET